MVFWKLMAFVRAAIQVQRSYRLRYLMQGFTALLPLVGLFFLSRVFSGEQLSALDAYGGNYLPFVMVGMAVTLFSAISLRAVTGTLGTAQRTGTLEVLLLTRTSLPTMMVGWTIYPFLRSVLGLAIYMSGGLLIVGLSFSNANFLPAALAIVLVMIVMTSIGLISAGFLLVFKQGDPFTGLFLLGGVLLAGTVYPVSVLPEWLQVVARLFPQMHGLEATRLAILKGHSVADVSNNLGVLLIYATVLVPVSLLVFKLGLHRAKVEGSLAHY